jgi:hypothetical protein
VKNASLPADQAAKLIHTIGALARTVDKHLRLRREPHDEARCACCHRLLEQARGLRQATMQVA